MYKPKIGERVKLRLMEHYREINLPAWSWLRVDKVQGAYAECVHMDGSEEKGKYNIALQNIEPPIGYAEVYEVHQDHSLIQSTISKMRRWADNGGVQVWASHDLSTAGRKTYTQYDANQTRPHWSMYPVEVVKDMSRFKFFAFYETYDKPSKAEKKKHGWTYDRRARNWWREEEVKL